MYFLLRFAIRLLLYISQRKIIKSYQTDGYLSSSVHQELVELHTVGISLPRQVGLSNACSAIRTSRDLFLDVRTHETYLKNWLKDNPDRPVRRLFLDNCGTRFRTFNEDVEELLRRNPSLLIVCIR
jgi:hypothetical protein